MDLATLLTHLKSKRVEDLVGEAVVVAYLAFWPDFLFFHTERVAFWAKRLASEKGEDVDTALLAAWLHDIGYVENGEAHREVGARALERRFSELGIQLEPVLDAVLNHGSKDRPETEVGHIIRLADALSLWDPALVGHFIEEVCQEREKFLGMLRKKKRVIEEYGYPFPFERTKRLIDRCCSGPGGI